MNRKVIAPNAGGHTITETASKNSWITISCSAATLPKRK